jgi:hypothetical protein
VPEHPDEIEVALRTWSAQEKIIGETNTIVELMNLDPALAEEVSVACRGGNATHISAADARLFGAANEELEKR